MRKILAALLIIILIAAIVFAAYKQFFAKKDQAEPGTSEPSENNQPGTVPDSPSVSDPVPDSKPSSPGTSETPSGTGDENIKDETDKQPPLTSSRDKTATLSFSAEGNTEEFDTVLFISDFGKPEYDAKYSIYVDTDQFALTRGEDSDIFETESGAKMEISIHRGTTGEALSPSFMDSYIDFTDIEFDGNSAIGKTGLTGFTINASGAEKSSNAYLINFEGDVIAVVLTYSNEMAEGYFPRMLAMVDTFKIED